MPQLLNCRWSARLWSDKVILHLLPRRLRRLCHFPELADFLLALVEAFSGGAYEPRIGVEVFDLGPRVQSLLTPHAITDGRGGLREGVFRPLASNSIAVRRLGRVHANHVTRLRSQRLRIVHFAGQVCDFVQVSLFQIHDLVMQGAN